MNTDKKRSVFTRFTNVIANMAGSPYAVMFAMATVLVWACLGPVFGFSDTWQLVINTGTTILTFLMVFVIQSSQNRDTHAMQLKLDELIRATEGAHNVLLDLEELSDDELCLISDKYEAIAQEARLRLARGETCTNVAKIDIL